MNTGTKLLIGFGSLAFVGVGGYWVYQALNEEDTPKESLTPDKIINPKNEQSAKDMFSKILNRVKEETKKTDNVTEKKEIKNPLIKINPTVKPILEEKLVEEQQQQEKNIETQQKYARCPKPYTHLYKVEEGEGFYRCCDLDTFRALSDADKKNANMECKTVWDLNTLKGLTPNLL